MTDRRASTRLLSIFLFIWPCDQSMLELYLLLPQWWWWLENFLWLFSSSSWQQDRENISAQTSLRLWLEQKFLSWFQLAFSHNSIWGAYGMRVLICSRKRRLNLWVGGFCACQGWWGEQNWRCEGNFSQSHHSLILVLFIFKIISGWEGVNG